MRLTGHYIESVCVLGGGFLQRSKLKGQEIIVRQCHEQQLVHQLMTSREIRSGGKTGRQKVVYKG